MTAVAALLLALIGTDRLGDPLGLGVTARYGTARLRQLSMPAPDVRLAVHPTRPEVRQFIELPIPSDFLPCGFVPPDEIRWRWGQSGRLTHWQRIVLEPDTDPNALAFPPSEAGRLVVVQFRVEAKADRYRGHPECFVQVFDTAARRSEARYAFRLDDIGTGERLKPSEEGDGGYAFHTFTPSADGTCLAWIDHDGCLRVRHLPTGRVVTATGRYHQATLTFGPNNQRLAVLDDDRIVRLIDPYTGRFQNAADNPATAAKQTAISPDGKLVATGHACGEVWVWDAATGKPLWHTDPDGSAVRELHFNPTGTTVSAVGFWGPIGVRTWTAKTGQELGPMLPYRYYRTLAVSSDGKRIADLIEEKSVMEKGQWAYPLFVRTREVATGKELARVRLDHRLGLGNETNAVVSRDGRVLVVEHTDSATFAYDTATGKRLVELDVKQGDARRWQLSDDGRIALSTCVVSRPRQIVFVVVTIFDLAAKFPGHSLRDYNWPQPFGGVEVSPDGRYMTLPVGEGERIYDTKSGEVVRTLSSGSAAFFPDGKSVLTLPGIRGAERVSLEPLAWKVAPPGKPSEARLKLLWTQLGEPAAMDAVFELARHSAEAVPFLKSKLLADTPDAPVVAAHVERLGSKLFADREEASKALRALSPETQPALRAALKAGPSPEVCSRLEKLLAVHADTAAPFALARLRAVEVLERCGTPDARAVLKTLADTRPGTAWADDAARALKRMGK